MGHACVTNFTSFMRTVKGQLHLNGILFHASRSIKNKLHCCFYSAKHFKSTVAFFLRFCYSFD